MKIPIVGTIETGSDVEPMVHLLEWMITQASTLFWVGADEYILTAKDELYKRVGEDDNKKPVLVNGNERAAILSTWIGRIAESRG